MSDWEMNDMEGALEALASMIDRSEKARAKFAPGSSQHSLQENRIRALRVASSLLEAELAGRDAAGLFAAEELEKAAAPLASLRSKSEKARTKLAAGSWQHAMLSGNLRALDMAVPLLEKALGKR